jgi:hypothetical protein
MNSIDARMLQFVKQAGLFDLVKEAGSIHESARRAAIALQQTNARLAKAAKGTAAANKARELREARAAKRDGVKLPQPSAPVQAKVSPRAVEQKAKLDDIKRVQAGEPKKPVTAEKPTKAPGWMSQNKLPLAGGAAAGLAAAGATHVALRDEPGAAGAAAGAAAGGPGESGNTWAQDTFGISTGSNLGDAAVATGGIASIYALYRALRDKDEDEE